MLRFFAVPGSRRRLSGFGLLLGILSCGRLERTAEPPPPPAETPWLVVRRDVDMSHAGQPMVALRIHGGEIERVVLDELVTGHASWSQSGRWMTYATTNDANERRQWVRRFDGQRWHSPEVIGVYAGVNGMPRARWSPMGDALLLERSSTAGPEISVVRPRDDGPAEVKVIATGATAGADWAPVGDRVLVRYGNPNVTRLSIIDLPASGSPADVPWLSHEVRPPEGESFDRFDSHPDENPLAHGTLSTDGRFIVFVTKGASKQLRAFSTTGDTPPRALEGCLVSREGSPGDTCRPRHWIPGTATLLLERLGSHGTSVDAWDVETGGLRSLGAFVSDGFPSGSRRIWMVKDADPPYERALIDLEDIAAPRVMAVPELAQRSLQHTTLSPQGRWLLLHHRSEGEEWIQAFDMRSGMVDAPREIFRRPRTNSTEHRLSWSRSDDALLVSEAQAGLRNNEIERVTRVELEPFDGPASTTLAIPKGEDARLYMPPSNDALGPDGLSLVLRRQNELVLWQWGRPLDTMRAVDAPASVFSWAGLPE